MRDGFQFGFEGLTAVEEDDLKAMTRRVAELAKASAAGSIGNRAKWFGALANSALVTEALKTMDKYINQQCVRLTFVRKHVGQIIDAVPAEAEDYGQVIPNIMTTTANFKQTAPHVSKGLRIFAMNEIIDAIKDNDRKEKINYIYHEISHKVLDTVDFRYGEEDCIRLAQRHPKSAVRNADNFGYYIAELDALV